MEPFTDVICTPSCYKVYLNSNKHIKYNGYKELAYLHPNYFMPDRSVLDQIKLGKSDRLIFLRSVAWKASHDINDKGFDNVEEVAKQLEKYGTIIISSENANSPYVKEHTIPIAQEKIHHLLAFADLYIGESATMASESAILGTPAIFVSTSRRGYTDELESKYDLLYTFSDRLGAQENAVRKAIELLENENTKRSWLNKRAILLNDKIDVTKFIIEIIEGYSDHDYYNSST
jgi:hypothetical protein